MRECEVCECAACVSPPPPSDTAVKMPISSLNPETPPSGPRAAERRGWEWTSRLGPPLQRRRHEQPRAERLAAPERARGHRPLPRRSATQPGRSAGAGGQVAHAGGSLPLGHFLPPRHPAAELRSGKAEGGRGRSGMLWGRRAALVAPTCGLVAEERRPEVAGVGDPEVCSEHTAHLALRVVARFSTTGPAERRRRWYRPEPWPVPAPLLARCLELGRGSQALRRKAEGAGPRLPSRAGPPRRLPLVPAHPGSLLPGCHWRRCLRIPGSPEPGPVGSGRWAQDSPPTPPVASLPPRAGVWVCVARAPFASRSLPCQILLQAASRAGGPERLTGLLPELPRPRDPSSQASEQRHSRANKGRAGSWAPPNTFPRPVGTGRLRPRRVSGSLLEAGRTV